jgi:hypothetical protein
MLGNDVVRIDLQLRFGYLTYSEVIKFQSCNLIWFYWSRIVGYNVHNCRQYAHRDLQIFFAGIFNLNFGGTARLSSILPKL